MDLFIIFSCFLRALKVVYLYFKEVRGWARSFKTLRRFANKWLISINMFIVSKSVEYLPYIGHPQYLTYLFIVNLIVRSLCFLENISPVKLPPKIFLWDVFTVIYFIYKELLIENVDLPDSNCNLDPEMQKTVTAELSPLLNSSQR